MEKLTNYGVVIFKGADLNWKEDYILKYPDDLSNFNTLRQCSKKFFELKKKRQNFENKSSNIICILYKEIYIICFSLSKFSNSEIIIKLVKEFLTNDFKEENFENFKSKKFLQKIFKLNEIAAEANKEKEKDSQIKYNYDKDETINYDVNLTDALLIENEKNSSTIFVESEKSYSNLNGYKTNDKTHDIEMEVFNCGLKSTIQSKKSKNENRFNEDKGENIIDILQELDNKELKGPVLFKIDTTELGYVRIWRKIKFVILFICIISAFAFYTSLPIIISLYHD